MDVNSRLLMGILIHHPGDERDIHDKELMSYPVDGQGLDAGVGEDDLPKVTCGWVPFKGCTGIHLQADAQLWQNGAQVGDGLVCKLVCLTLLEGWLVIPKCQKKLSFQEGADFIQLKGEYLFKAHLCLVTATASGKHQFQEFIGDIPDDLHLGKRFQAVEVCVPGNTVEGPQKCAYMG